MGTIRRIQKMEKTLMIKCIQVQVPSYSWVLLYLVWKMRIN